MLEDKKLRVVAAQLSGTGNQVVVGQPRTLHGAAPGSLQRSALARTREAVRSYPLTSFVLITFAWSWAFWGFLLWSEINYDLRIWKYLYVAGLSGPLVASLGITFFLEGREGVWQFIRRALVWRFSPGWYLTAICLAPLLMLGAVGAYQLLFHQSIEVPKLTLRMALVVFGWMIVRGGPGNEEFGWRAFLLPRLLRRHNPFSATLILIPIWAGWHLPLWFLPGLPHRYWHFLFFIFLLAPLSFLFTWLYLKSGGSVLSAILFHSSINTGIHFLPILPPRYSGLGPFALWVAVSWVVTSLILSARPRLWVTPAQVSDVAR